MPPTVSVVIATYNYGRYLAGAIESVLAQTYGDWELIVVDDGSTDSTPEVARPFLCDPRIRYHRTNHQKQPKTKNTGIRLARGRYIAFLDADDRWLPTKLQRQVALFRSDPDLGVCYSGRLCIDEDGRPLPTRRATLYRGHVLREMFKDNFACFSSCVVRREVLDEVGLFDETLDLAIDYDLWLRVARRYRFDYVDEPLVHYRTGHANLSRRGEERLLTALRIMDRFLDQYGGRALLPAAWVRRAYAETYAHVGEVKARRSRLAALPWHLRALGTDPRCMEAWRLLATLFVPETARRLIRKLLLSNRSSQRRLGRCVARPTGPASL